MSNIFNSRLGRLEESSQMCDKSFSTGWTKITCLCNEHARLRHDLDSEQDKIYKFESMQINMNWDFVNYKCNVSRLHYDFTFCTRSYHFRKDTGNFFKGTITWKCKQLHTSLVILNFYNLLEKYSQVYYSWKNLFSDYFSNLAK